MSGDHVYIHDCSIWNQDDCIAVKDGSNDMLFERIEASGIGLTIGSIGGSKNNNITFRDCHMHKTGKGIYMKFRGNGGTVSNVTYQRRPPPSPACRSADRTVFPYAPLRSCVLRMDGTADLVRIGTRIL
eukprot:COSAG05_NODE_1838_length_3985_cov_6.972723_2_plen_129_part_00